MRFNPWTLGLAAAGAVSLRHAETRKTSREIHKENLYAAVIGYRGQNDPATGKWLQLPNVEERRTIISLLLKLGRTKAKISEDAVKIDGFKTSEEIISWIHSL